MIAKAEGGPARKYMIWWTECETIKVTARYAILHGRKDLWPVFDRCLEFVRTNYFDREHPAHPFYVEGRGIQRAR